MEYSDMPWKQSASDIRNKIKKEHASNRRRLALLKHQIAKEYKKEKQKNKTPMVSKIPASQTPSRGTLVGTPYRGSELKRDWAVRIPPGWVIKLIFTIHEIQRAHLKGALKYGIQKKQPLP